MTLTLTAGAYPHTPTLPPSETELVILTLNTQKVGINSPSLTDMVTLLDRHTPRTLSYSQKPHCTHNKGHSPRSSATEDTKPTTIR